MWQPLRLMALLFALAGAFPAAAQELSGSGSTFIFPVMTKWLDAYEKASGVRIRYQPIGSSAGIGEIRASVVDFGVTDAPLNNAQLLRDGLMQFPLVIGAVVPVVNLDGIAPGQLRFTGKLLADIYLGRVKNWNDPAIAAVNPDTALPNRPILPVYRTDGSGTTFNFANFLAKSSPDWNAKIGASTSVAWPVGSGGKGNRGVGEMVTSVEGSIGYVEFSFAQQKKLAYGVVQNRAGNFVMPDAESFLAAISGVDWSKTPDFDVLLTDAPEANAFPIMATSFALLHKYPKRPERNREAFEFFQWALEKGQDLASGLSYVPLPAPLVSQVEGYWKTAIN